jgi:hypothetical protein
MRFPGRKRLKRWMQFLKLLPQPSVIEIHGVRTLARHPKLSTAVRWRLYTGRYERPEIELVGGHLQPDDRYLELGAGLGIVSIFATRRLAEGAVKSFEADPEMGPRRVRTHFPDGGYRGR